MSQSLPPAHSRPSRIRHLVVGVTALVAVLLYLDRFCISIAEIFIKEDLGLSDIQVGWMLSAFFWTYALCQVPSGWLTDRFGARIMLTIYILSWSLFTGLTGIAGGLAMLLVLRLGFGVAQAGAYPTGASIISKWVPFTNRGTASSIVSVGGRVGGWLALFITGPLIVLYVPTLVPSQISRGDLLSIPRLSHDLVSPETKSKDGEPRFAAQISAKILTRLSTDVKESTERSSALFEDFEQEKAAAKKEKKEFEKYESDIPLPPRPQVEQLTSQLNQIIDDPQFISKQELNGTDVYYALENEAKRLLERDPKSLNSSEVRRMNRLIVEAAYPESIKKVYGHGWRMIMWSYGLMGLVVAALFWFTFRDQPQIHPRVNSAEVELIEYGRPKSAPKAHGKVGGVPLLRIVLSGSMWLICLSQWCTNVGWVFIVTWAPRYFISVHQVPIETRSYMLMIPPLVGWAGMVLGGKVTDTLVPLVGLRWGRALPMSLSRFMAMGAYLYCLWEPTPWLAVVAFSIVAFSTDLGTASVWAFKQDVGGRYVGSILGWGNMWGNLGAAITPVLLIWIIQDSPGWNLPVAFTALVGTGDLQNWNLAFLTCAAAFMISGLAALGVNATIPIAPKDEDAKDGFSKDDTVD